ncbi:hypothetical protein MNBD_GAMMA07-381 [hydrothermal vent metagenome]|uniref:FHA domain-containing protein n=1 Tax=hydrothermal vent metagenome TaxID=652676 RepID=A0A3B0WWV5_9ZZZZ
MEKKTYIIGRKGSIPLFDKTTSSRHAQLVIDKNKMYLTDLNSTNGTFLVHKGKREPFKKGFIDIEQTLSFGSHVCTVRELVARAKIAY